MTTIAIKRRVGLLNPDLSKLRAAAAACVEAWDGGTAPQIKMYWLRKPKGSWRIFWSNQLPLGAAGVHLDAKGVPYALISPRFGLEVVAHEALEMLIDPAGERFKAGMSLRTGKMVHYLVEVCDPVEGTPYAWVAPDFYLAPSLDPVGYISWIEDGDWWQAYQDAGGSIGFDNLGSAMARTRAEKDRLAVSRGRRAA